MVTCLLFFPLRSEKDYIITPMHDCDEKGSKIYSFKTGQLIKNIDTGYNYVNTILPWYNKIDKKDYIIQICEMKIYINNIIEDKRYCELNDETENFNGFIYNKNEKDYLCVSKYSGGIHIWDLHEKRLIKMFKIGKDYLTIRKWNDNYVIGINNGIKIIDLEKGKIVKEIKNEINYAQTLIHPEYGTSLIAMDKKNISLWVE